MAMIKSTEIAAHLRGELKTKFPGVKFAVQTRNAGGTIAVTWTDGPTRDELRPIVNPLKVEKDVWGSSINGDITVNGTRGQVTGKSYVEYIHLNNTRTR